MISQRSDAEGKLIESIQEGETISKRFYPLTPDGPFVSKAWPSKFEYCIVDRDGKQQPLTFLTTHDIYEQYLAFFPISGGRWIGLSPLANAPVRDSLRVSVFGTHGVLFSNVVAGCYHNDSEALRTLSRPAPLRSAIRFYDYDFDSGREDVRFRTHGGNFVFDANAGNLKKAADE